MIKAGYRELLRLKEGYARTERRKRMRSSQINTLIHYSLFAHNVSLPPDVPGHVNPFSKAVSVSIHAVLMSHLPHSTLRASVYRLFCLKPCIQKTPLPPDCKSLDEECSGTERTRVFGEVAGTVRRRCIMHPPTDVSISGGCIMCPHLW